MGGNITTNSIIGNKFSLLHAREKMHSQYNYFKKHLNILSNLNNTIQWAILDRESLFSVQKLLLLVYGKEHDFLKNQ